MILRHWCWHTQLHLLIAVDLYVLIFLAHSSFDLMRSVVEVPALFFLQDIELLVYGLC